MTRKKQKRYEEILSFENMIFEPDKIKGKWNEEIFKNKYKIILELGCGKGEYTTYLAKNFPENNYIGIDIKGARLWKGASNAIEQKLDNVRFIRGYIDHIDTFFDEDEIDEIWITFPDPYVLKSNEKKRLTSVNFLKRYKKILKNGGNIHLKTDSDSLYEFTINTLNEQNLDIFYKSKNIYLEDFENLPVNTKTYFEEKAISQGKTIKLISFKIDNLKLG